VPADPNPSRSSSIASSHSSRGKKKPSARELQAAATKRMTIDLQIDRLNGLANDDPPLPFPHTSQIDGLRASFAATTAARTTGSSTGARATCSSCST
jgi:hypothetical protein